MSAAILASFVPVLPGLGTWLQPFLRRNGPKSRNAAQCEFVVGQSASGDEVCAICVCVATGALRKLRFSANFSDHNSPVIRPYARCHTRGRRASARGGLDSCAVARRAATFW
eukprot:COSAG06_NODE_6500_length_2905_cov_90.985388_4_plen_112_part_00